MEYNIRAYVDELFCDAPDTQRAYEMKVELVQNLLDKYNDLVASGKSEEDAYNITIYGIGDISELLEEMRREEPQPVRGAEGTSYYTAMYYFRRRSAAIIAVSVMLYIFSVIPVIVLGAMSTHSHNGDMMAVFGVAGMFVFIGIATGLIIWNGITSPKRSDPPEVVIDLYNRKKGGSDHTPLLRAIDSAFWLIVLAVYFLLSFMTGRWDITWILFIAAPAISGILHAVLGRK
ncbi:permease prefix domain 1-containing protein [Anaeromassilibacillus senegalensis]|uniref:Uncharacterized protein n=1 Tax=Anaeromassilibacillus senegalensis TaxID=1673717 RepID=A0ABS9CMH6_9FIRM|nr:permease prefix domain 1-containing protein [Anaeromassilibacillus senegalensis]MCF2652259.1 hypothetical protein [Anaeromassilibacillus senegalensis]